MTAEWLWVFALTVVDLTAAAIVFAGALREHMRLYPSWHKVGLIMASFGLVAQAGLNTAFLVTGQQVAAHTLPFWVLKDLGIAAIAYFYVWHGYQKWRETKVAKPETKPAKRATPRPKAETKRPAAMRPAVKKGAKHA